MYMINKKLLSADVTLLLARLIIGGIFIYSAYMKMSDMAFTLGGFTAMGIPVFLAYIVTYGEMIFGITLVLGLYNAISTLFLSVVMIFATYYTYSAGFQYYGMTLAILAGTLALHGVGPGKYKLGPKAN